MNMRTNLRDLNLSTLISQLIYAELVANGAIGGDKDYSEAMRYKLQGEIDRRLDGEAR